MAEREQLFPEAQMTTRLPQAPMRIAIQHEYRIPVIDVTAAVELESRRHAADETDVGQQAGAEAQRVWRVLQCAHLLLQMQMYPRNSLRRTRAAGDEAVFARGIAEVFDEVFTLLQSQKVDAGKVDVLPTVTPYARPADAVSHRQVVEISLADGAGEKPFESPVVARCIELRARRFA